jgi:hypothetical protein
VEIDFLLLKLKSAQDGYLKGLRSKCFSFITYPLFSRYAHCINLLPFTPATEQLLPLELARSDAPSLLASWAQRGTEGGGWAPDTTITAAGAVGAAGAGGDTNTREVPAAPAPSSSSSSSDQALLPPVQAQWGGLVLAEWAVANPQAAWNALLELYGTPRGSDSSASSQAPPPLDAGESLSNLLYWAATRPFEPS